MRPLPWDLTVQHRQGPGDTLKQGPSLRSAWPLREPRWPCPDFDIVLGAPAAAVHGFGQHPCTTCAWRPLWGLCHRLTMTQVTRSLSGASLPQSPGQHPLSWHLGDMAVAPRKLWVAAK